MLKNRVKNNEDDAYWIVVNGSSLWLVDDKIPFGNHKDLSLPPEKAICIGKYENCDVMWVNEVDIESPLEMTSLRDHLLMPQALFLLASKAIQYGHMTQTQRFCAQCGGRNFLNHNEIAMQCGECRKIHYPRIFPCIIVAVRNDDKILLAQHPQHKGGMFTVIAGFLEVGETLEQCVAREVKEETGLNINNIRYFDSQPWAFPTNMMIGFLADYESGDIKPDYSELADVKWFTPEQIPPIAPKGTIARALIDKTIENIKQKKE
ncbi:NAD(+) diphosphatase [Vibrio sp. TH_r3]|uniref:NAD(+) diphosphatase n=1 Tax=Vibrio sp. TH_r3 TaxID=3082084 RepID=UPI002952E425|nr:NAD(+) diphosphatase [Vibrio sp. TH_r3]MDV7106153.1 NAD(+) diphosphatase [Vibrio sp. TH_r3]